MAGITHAFTNPNADGANATVVRPSDWNAAHLIDGLKFGAGTSFPISPAPNDLFNRTDRSLIYYYDGTRWLCTCPHEAAFPLVDAAINGTVAANAAVGVCAIPRLGTYSLWLDHIDFGYQVSTNSGVNFWSFLLNYYTNVGGRVAIVSGNTSALAASSNGTITVAIGAVLNAAAVNLEYQVTKTGTPATLFAWGAFIEYRMIG